MSQNDPPHNWVSIRHLQHFLARGEVAGLDGTRLLDALGVSRPQLDDAEATLPVSALEPVLESLTGDAPDRPIGLLLAADVQPATFGALGFLTQSSPRLANVLELLVRYNGLLSDIGHFSLQSSPGRMHLHWECRAGGPLFRRHAREYVLASVVILARTLLPTGSDFPLAVSFPHAPPAPRRGRQAYQDLFRCPVYFERPGTTLSVAHRLLGQPLRHGDPAIRRALEQHADALLQRRRQHRPLADEVSRLITAMLGEHDPSVREIAHQLGLSERSLHRKLRAEGSGFRALLDEARLVRARALLRHSNQPLEVLATRLGLQSRQSLIRWFRQRTGVTPGQFRKEL